MKREEIERTLYRLSKTWRDSYKFHVREEFIQEMSDKQYGYEALLDAWTWFHSGWKAKENF